MIQNKSTAFNYQQTPPIKNQIRHRKKRLSFNSFFSVHSYSNITTNKHQSTTSNEDCDGINVDPSMLALDKGRKYQSAIDLNRKPPPDPTHHKLLRRIASFRSESKGLLKRSLSFTGLRIKRENTCEKIRSEMKAQEWKQSLQSLVEFDNGVSYQDLSFIDYDAFNAIDYTDNSNQIAVSSSFHQRTHMNLLEEEVKQSIVSQVFTLEQCIGLQSSPISGVTQMDIQSRSLHFPRCILQNSQHFQHIYCCQSEIVQFQDVNINFQVDNNCEKCTKPDHMKTCENLNSIANYKPYLKCRNYRSSKLRVNELTGRSRSLNHIDKLELRSSGTTSEGNSTLKDSYSVPDCVSTCTPTNEILGVKVSELSKDVRSNQYFTVQFENVGNDDNLNDKMMIPAKCGITLEQCLKNICKQHSINLKCCDIYIPGKDSKTRIFLPTTQDTYSLVGKDIRIFVIGKETYRKQNLGSLRSTQSERNEPVNEKENSSKYRTSSMFSSSTDEGNTLTCSIPSTHDADQSRRQIKQRLTAFFVNSKDSKYENLIDQLDKYSRLGIPSNTSTHYVEEQCEAIDALYQLEDDWRIILNDIDLNEKQQQQQTALWELIKSEVSYIKTLTVVTNLFLTCLRDLQSKNLLKEIDTDKLFSNITEIRDANLLFWKNTLFPIVYEMRKSSQPVGFQSILNGFRAIRDTFHPYYKYCAEQSRCQYYCRENMDSELFTAYLTWCESQKECNRLRLMDILVQPMQRLTKYGLLIKAILRNTVDDTDRVRLRQIVEAVDDFVVTVNLSLKNRQDNERIRGIIARIESYDICDAKDDDIERMLKKFPSLTQLDLTAPMIGCLAECRRHLLLEGDLKLKDNYGAKSEVHCFLLTDLLLVCKASAKNKGVATMRVVRQPYLVDRLQIHELQKETPSLSVIYMNEFGMAIAAFILQINDAKKLKGWKDGILKAQTLYKQAKKMTTIADDSLDTDYISEGNLDFDNHSLQLSTKGALITSPHGSRGSSVGHSHSGSVEITESAKEPTQSLEFTNWTASGSSDEGVQSLSQDKVSRQSSGQQQQRPSDLLRSSNTLSVQRCCSTFGQSLPNLAVIMSTNSSSPSSSASVKAPPPHQTLSVPGGRGASRVNSSSAAMQLLSPTTHRGVSYPPSSPNRGNLQRSLAISHGKNPPLVKMQHMHSSAAANAQLSLEQPSFEFDGPLSTAEFYKSFTVGQNRSATIKRMYRTNKRYHISDTVSDDKTKENPSTIEKRSSWNCSDYNDDSL